MPEVAEAPEPETVGDEEGLFTPDPDGEGAPAPKKEPAAKVEPEKPVEGAITEEEIEEALGEKAKAEEPSDKPEGSDKWTKEEQEKFFPAMEKQATKWKGKLTETEKKISDLEAKLKSQERDILVARNILNDPQAVEAITGVKSGKKRLVDMADDSPTPAELKAAFDEGDMVKFSELTARMTSAQVARAKKEFDEAREQERTTLAHERDVAEFERQFAETSKDPVLGPLLKSKLFADRVTELIESSGGQLGIRAAAYAVYGEIDHKRTLKMRGAGGTPRVPSEETHRGVSPGLSSEGKERAQMEDEVISGMISSET